MNHWRLKTWTGYPEKIDIGWYCLKHSVGAMGWCLWALQSEMQSRKISINNILDYMKLAHTVTKYPDNQLLSVEYLDSAKGAKTGDLIWMYDRKQIGDRDSDFYIARVEEDSKYHYNLSNEAYANDACNELTNLHWLKVGKQAVVYPGVVRALWHRGYTFRRISVAPQEYSQLVYNKLSNTQTYNVHYVSQDISDWVAKI